MTSLVQLQLDTPSRLAAVTSDDFLTEANELIIDSPMMMEFAAEQLISLKTMLDQIETERKEMVEPINTAHAKVQSFFKRHSDPLKSAIAIIKEKYVACDQNLERIAAEEQKIQDEQAAEIRARLATEASVAQAESDSEVLGLREQASAAAAAGDTVKAAQLRSEADAQEESGLNKASELAFQAATTVAPVVVSPVSKVTGISSARAVWKYSVEDESKIPREFLCPDEKKLAAYAKAMKESASVPGVRFFNDATISVRARA